jgi:hypothetical protein
MSSTSKILQLSDIPYSQRQLIVVQPNDLVNAERASRAAGKGSSLGDLAANVGGFLVGGFWGMEAATALVKEAYGAWQRARASGLNVMAISNTEATQLTFPPGHPRLGALYAAHPAKRSIYYTVAMFHRMAFEHKFSEAVGLLMSLGASSIEVKHAQGWSREFSATLSSPIPAASIDASVSAKGAQGTNLLFHAEFDNECIPQLPENMVWYEHEPTWSNVANGRLQFGMKQFSLTVAYQDDYGVNAGLKMNAVRSGLDMGGSFEAHTDTTWVISGTFRN